MTPTIPVWKLTRTAPARRLYDGLARAGLRVSVLDLFRRDLTRASPEPGSTPDGIQLEVVRAGDRLADWNVEDSGLEADHLVLGAVAEGRLVGEALLSIDGPVYVEPLDRTIPFDGGYLWGLAVDPDWRRRGVASALLASALERLEEAGTQRAHALVAPDNVPSRALFRSAGFEPNRRHTFVDVFGFQHRSSRNYTGDRSPENR